MATGPRIVHKQFNSPIGLYSQNNIEETLSKHMQNLGNGTVGIDFHNPSTGKPANLANSAVLRMLEEEERNRKGHQELDPSQVQVIMANLVRMNHRFDSFWPPKRDAMKPARSWDGQLNANCQVYPKFWSATKKGQKKVVWPPTPETNGYHASQPSPAQQQHHQQLSPNQPQYQTQHQSQQHYQSQQHSPQLQYQSPSQYQSAPPQGYCEGRRQAATGLSKLIPVGPGASPTPTAPYRQGPPSPGVAQPYGQQSSRWAPVPGPVSPQAYSNQPSYQQQQQLSPQPQYSPNTQYSSNTQYSPNQQYSEPAYQPPQRTFEPPPSTITLRPQQPVHQKPSPVFTSQPAAASFKGGVNMRGDQKWPPQSVKEAVEAENEARRQLARGPACRPRKVRKDYSAFFAKHALSNNYPGYRVPPGTQHYEDHSGRSAY